MREVEKSFAIGCPPWLCLKGIPIPSRVRAVRPVFSGANESLRRFADLLIGAFLAVTLDGLKGKKFPQKRARWIHWTGFLSETPVHGTARHRDFVKS